MIKINSLRLLKPYGISFISTFSLWPIPPEVILFSPNHRGSFRGLPLALTTVIAFTPLPKDPV